MKKILLAFTITLISQSQLKAMESPLSMADAALSDNWQLVKQWLRSGADPNECEPESPIFAFIFKKNKKVIEKLVKNYGADINISDSTLGTPLTFALTMQRLDIAQFLVKLGADIDLPDGYGVTPRQELTPQKSGSYSPAKDHTDKGIAVDPFELGQKLLLLNF